MTLTPRHRKAQTTRVPAPPLMTTFVRGVPGSVTTALLLAALTMHGLQAEPQLVYEQIPLVYGLIVTATISRVLMVAATVGAGYGLSGALAVPTRILIRFLMVFSIPIRSEKPEHTYELIVGNGCKNDPMTTAAGEYPVRLSTKPKAPQSSIR